MTDVNKEVMGWVHAQPHWVQLAAIKIYTQEEAKDELIEMLVEDTHKLCFFL